MTQKFEFTEKERAELFDSMSPLTKHRKGLVVDRIESIIDSRAESDGWVNCEDRLPTELNEWMQSKECLVFINNPYFSNDNIHTAYLQKGIIGNTEYVQWRGIEPNVHHGNEQPIVTHWMPLPSPPKSEQK